MVGAKINYPPEGDEIKSDIACFHLAYMACLAHDLQSVLKPV